MQKSQCVRFQQTNKSSSPSFDDPPQYDNKDCKNCNPAMIIIYEEGHQRHCREEILQATWPLSHSTSSRMATKGVGGGSYHSLPLGPSSLQRPLLRRDRYILIIPSAFGLRADCDYDVIVARCGLHQLKKKEHVGISTNYMILTSSTFE
eukprot:scaffold5018_cov147-Skeletonema_menzelii.AAC.9